MNNKKILVTGATGFLGKYLIERLVSENQQVIGLTRTKNALHEFPVKEVVGDLNNIQVWESELAGCEVVIHCAAKVEFWGAWDDFYKDNTLATYNLLKSAVKQNVKRFIYISSESVLQDKQDLIDIDEAFPYPKEPNSYYGKSKMLAEQQIKAFDENIHKVILRPTFIYGKGANAITTMKLKIASGQFSWINKGEILMEMVYVKNVVEGIMKALVNGRNNEIYNITDHSQLNAKQFLTSLMSTENVAIPSKSIPSYLAKPISAIVENIWRTFNLKSYPLLTRFDLSFIAMNRRYRTEKAVQELDYKPIYSTTDAIADMNT